MHKKKKLDRAFIVLLIGIIFFPYSFQGMKVAGITLTVQRIVVPIMLMYWIGNGGKLYMRNRMLKSWICFSCFWGVIGSIYMGYSKWVSVSSGLKEVISIIYGAAILFLLNNLIQDREDLLFACQTIRILVIALIFGGIAEILTGMHLPGSIYNDANTMYLRYGANEVEISKNMATGFFYGVNDFASFLGAVSPFLLIQNKTRKEKALNLTALLLLGVILVKNDANIVLASVALGAILYLCVRYAGGYLKAALFIMAACSIMVSTVLLLDGNNLLGKMGLFQESVLGTQINNFYLGQGSLFSRLAIYRDAVAASFRNCFIGYGPASFSNYFISNSSVSGLVNPHGLIFEILFHYGCIILLLFIGLLFFLWKKNLSLYLKTRETECLIALTAVLIYLLVSFSPSSFVGYTYQWMIIGLSCLSADIIGKSQVS